MSTLRRRLIMIKKIKKPDWVSNVWQDTEGISPPRPNVQNDPSQHLNYIQKNPPCQVTVYLPILQGQSGTPLKPPLK